MIDSADRQLNSKAAHHVLPGTDTFSGTRLCTQEAGNQQRWTSNDEAQKASRMMAIKDRERERNEWRSRHLFVPCPLWRRHEARRADQQRRERQLTPVCYSSLLSSLLYFYFYINSTVETTSAFSLHKYTTTNLGRDNHTIST